MSSIVIGSIKKSINTLLSMLMIFTILIIFTACSQNTNRQEFSQNNSAPALSVTPKQASANMKLTKPTELLPEIVEKYSGIKILAINKNDGSKIEIVAPFGQKTAIDGTSLEIITASYFTNFTMVDGGVKNVSMEENNPSAKVIIIDNGRQVFDGWLFQEYPDMHPYENPVWRIVLAGAVRK